MKYKLQYRKRFRNNAGEIDYHPWEDDVDQPEDAVEHARMMNRLIGYDAYRAVPR